MKTNVPAFWLCAARNYCINLERYRKLLARVPPQLTDIQKARHVGRINQRGEPKMADISSSAFVAAPDGATRIVQLQPGALPAAAAIGGIVSTIQAAIASDAAAVTSGHTALPPPDNFHFTDLTVNVSGTITGDGFKGPSAGITSQFVDLTPDNLLITALTPGTFMRSDSGNDALIAAFGRNILSAGSGTNTFIGGSGQDTFLADASNAKTFESLFNFGPGDDAVILGLNATDFSFSIKDTLAGLEIDAVPAPNSTAKVSAGMVLSGYTSADVGTKLTLGQSVSADGAKSYFFVHGN